MKRSVSLVSNGRDKQVFTFNMGGANIGPDKQLPNGDGDSEEADYEIVE